VAQAARVTHALTRAGIMVHAYLMYGFPTETPRETIETLERVRQFFAAGLIQSAYWHRFTATAHSPVGLDPAAYGITLAGPPSGAFARNDLAHRDPVGGDPSAFGPGLARAVYHYMHGVGLDRDVRTWFDGRRPKPRVSPTLIHDVLGEMTEDEMGDTWRHDTRLVWLGGRPRVERTAGQWGSWRIALPGCEGAVSVAVSRPVAKWLADLIEAATPRGRQGRRTRPSARRRPRTGTGVVHGGARRAWARAPCRAAHPLIGACP
jgi:hypothetical protein